MRKSGPLDICVVCEALGDFKITTELADCCFASKCQQESGDALGNFRRWAQPEGRDFLSWSGASSLATKYQIKAHGHFTSGPGKPDAVAARRALLLVMKLCENIDAIILVRDTDGDLTRREGLNQARDDSKMNQRIVLGICHPKRECWILAGFTPANKYESESLKQIKRDLGFDPVTQSSRLNGKKGQKRDAKRVLRELGGGDSAREACCWCETDLEQLRRNGADNGLREFLDEISGRLIPLIASGDNRSGQGLANLPGG